MTDGNTAKSVINMKFKIVIKHVIEEEKELELSYENTNQALDDAGIWLKIFNEMAAQTKTDSQTKNSYALKSITEVKGK